MAKEQGLSLIGPDGLLKQLTKTVLETALNDLSAGAVVDPDPSLLRMAYYPETVGLAGLLANDDWRRLAAADSSLSDCAPTARSPGDQYLRCRFDSGYPLIAWQEGEALRRRQRQQRQPGYRGSEVWLSRPASCITTGCRAALRPLPTERDALSVTS